MDLNLRLLWHWQFYQSRPPVPSPGFHAQVRQSPSSRHAIPSQALSTIELRWHARQDTSATVGGVIDRHKYGKNSASQPPYPSVMMAAHAVLQTMNHLFPAHPRSRVRVNAKMKWWHPIIPRFRLSACDSKLGHRPTTGTYPVPGEKDGGRNPSLLLCGLFGGETNDDAGLLYSTTTTENPDLAQIVHLAKARFLDIRICNNGVAKLRIRRVRGNLTETPSSTGCAAVQHCNTPPAEHVSMDLLFLYLGSFFLRWHPSRVSVVPTARRRTLAPHANGRRRDSDMRKMKTEPITIVNMNEMTPLLETGKESEGENMRSPDPTLPSITFVLAQPALTTRGGMRRRGKFGVRRTKSSPSFGAPDGPHPPRYPPQLNSDFLEESHRSIVDARKTVDYRFSNSLPRAPSRSSFALPKDIFDADAEIEIIAPSPTESEPASTAGSSCSTASSSRSNRTRPQRTRAVKALMQSLASGRKQRAMNTRIPFEIGAGQTHDYAIAETQRVGRGSK
ncbi:hypothetical protein F5888DRAFT_1636990 [Russula emetica]|nr:hypothetical protein F5888DRAFT_1636990 [Russula emetica]